MLASMAGFVIFAGEFVGGGVAPIIAGGLASNPDYGLKGALYFRSRWPRRRVRGRAVPERDGAAQDRPGLKARGGAVRQRGALRVGSQ